LQENKITYLADLMRSSRKTAVLTGAGISTPSGIPDFRSAGNGLWEDIDPFEVISLSAFRRDPTDFYDWLYPLAQRLQSAQPNAAHLALTALEAGGFIAGVATQNIDGLHQRAGSRQVFELHGSLEEMICQHCKDRRPSQTFWEPFLTQKVMPRCPVCGAVLKPDIVFFEEMLPVEAWTQSEELCSTCDLIIVMGSSLEVMPANQLPLTALRHKARLAIINRDPTPLDELASCLVSGNIEEVLPRLCLELGIGVN
jgi:NAD-dependent deacetylase